MFRPVTKTLLDNISHQISEADEEIKRQEYFIQECMLNKEGYSTSHMKRFGHSCLQDIVAQKNKINRLLEKQRELMNKEATILLFERDKRDIKEYLNLEEDDLEDKELVSILKTRSKELDYGRRRRSKKRKSKKSKSKKRKSKKRSKSRRRR